MNTRSIHFRLILWYSGLVIAVSLAFGMYVYKGVEQRLWRETERTFTRRAHSIADILREAPPAELANRISEVYSPKAGNRFIRILNADGSVLYVSGAPQDGSFDPSHVPLPASLAAGDRVEPVARGTSLFIVSVPVEEAGRPFLIEMGAESREMETTLNGLISTLLFGLPLVVIIVSAGGAALLRRALKPVEDIRATAEQITFGNLSNRLPVPETGDAFAHLTLTLNQMLERLDNAYQEMSRFSADASHELRTPLTIMRGELESIIRQGHGLPDELRERVGSVLEEAERLSRIVESLLAIARIDADAARAEPTVFSLADLVRTTADQMLLLAEEKNIRVRIDAAMPASVKGDPARLKQVVVNLLDNAIKYTPEGGNIAITVTNGADRVALSVTDTGIGIPPDALPFVFERFYRADKMRSRAAGGAGLGLSIVRSICHAHGGTVEIESTGNKGTTCRVFLPAAMGEH